jgi:hypothetical protein
MSSSIAAATTQLTGGRADGELVQSQVDGLVASGAAANLATALAAAQSPPMLRAGGSSGARCSAFVQPNLWHVYQC